MENVINANLEARRVKALHQLKILDTNADKEFDDIVLLAAQICKVPISLITFVDKDRQWFKSKLGVDITETPRNISICSQAIKHDFMIVPDLKEDIRFDHNPFVVGEPFVRFYAGVALTDENGYKLGTLCVMDKIPRVLDDVQLNALKILTRQVMKLIQLHSQVSASESKLSAYFNSTKDKIILLDPDQKIIAFNKESAQWTKEIYNKDMKNGDSMLSYVEPYLQEKFQNHFSQALLGIEQRHETKVNYKSFNIWWQVSYIPVKKDDGEITGVAFVNRNIDESKKSEEELVKSFEQKQYLSLLSEAVSRAEKPEQVYELALSALQNTLGAPKASILLFDEDGIMRFKASNGLSEAYKEKAQGHSPWSKDEKNASAIYIENVEVEPSLKALNSTIKKEGIVSLGFIPLIYKQTLLGKFMVYFTEPRHFTNAEKELAFLIATQVAYAIGQKNAETALLKSEDNLRTVFDNTQVGYILINNKLEILSFNYPASKYVEKRFNKKLLNGKIISDFFPEGSYEPRKKIHEALSGGNVSEFDFNVINPSGEEEWYNIKYSPVRTNSNEVTGLVLAFKNITLRKRNEIELNKSFELVSQQNKRLLNFSYIVSHNLRSHATNIKSILSFFNETSSEQEKNELVSYLNTVSNSLDETLLNLNQVVSINNNINLIFEPLHLHEYLQKTLSLLSNQIADKKATIVNTITQDIIVKYNPAFLESILFNFVSNAIKYCHPNRNPLIHLDCFIVNDKIVFQIKDNGLGINLKKHGDELFGMYKTFHGNTDARGIGLFISKSQVEFMGGHIEVESKIDHGTTFKIFF